MMPCLKMYFNNIVFGGFMPYNNLIFLNLLMKKGL